MLFVDQETWWFWPQILANVDEREVRDLTQDLHDGDLTQEQEWIDQIS
jgi:hypothetical protein